MRLRLICPSLRYFASFATNVCAPNLAALEYLAVAAQQKGEREYWIVDGVRCHGSVLIRFQPKGRKALQVVP